MIYGSELASNEAKQFLNDISHTAVDFAPNIPSFDIPLNDKLAPSVPPLIGTNLPRHQD